jgi:hypothetical protein
MHNTHTRSRVFRVLRVIITWLVTSDYAWSRRGMVCLMSSLFLSCIFLLLVNSTTPRLPHQPRLVARREVPRAVLGIWADRIWDGLGPSIYTGDVLYMGVLERFIRLSENWLTFYAVVSLSCRSLVRRAADRGRALSPNRRWWSETCTGADESGSRKCARTTARALLSTCSSSTISSSIRARDPL